jgi:hypothetical protein
LNSQLPRDPADLERATFRSCQVHSRAYDFFIPGSSALNRQQKHFTVMKFVSMGLTRLMEHAHVGLEHF